MKGGSQVAFPVYVKKLVHCVSVACFNVSAVGGNVVEGSHAKIWSAKVLGAGDNTNVMTELGSRSAVTLLLIVTTDDPTVFTTVPEGMLGPKTAMPAMIPLVPPEPPKVSVDVPDEASAVVPVAMQGIVLNTVRNVMADPLGTSPVTAALSVTFAAATLCTVVPGAIFVPMTAMPAVIPLVPPEGASVLLPDGQSPVVVAATGASAGLKMRGSEMLPVTAALSVTVVTVLLLDTVVPPGIFVPFTAMPALIPSVPPAPAKVNVFPDGILMLGDAVMGELPGLKVMTSVVCTPVEERSLVSWTVVMVTACVTVVPASILVPLTGIPLPIPIPVPSKVRLVPELTATLGLTANGGIT